MAKFIDVFLKCFRGGKSQNQAKFGDAGYDLFCADGFILKSMEPTGISTGVALEIPRGVYGRVAPKSGLGLRGVDVLGGVIDSSYRGVIEVILINFFNMPSF